MPAPPSLSRPFRLRWRWLLAALAAAALTGACGTLDTRQREWIFMHGATVLDAGTTPSERGDGIEDVWIEHHSVVSGGAVRLHGLWQPHEDPDAPAVLYLHGARRNVENSLFRVRTLQELGFSVLAIDYRGFGRSSAELPSEAGVYEDALAAWRWLAGREPERPRYIFGHSLGGAIAVNLASEAKDAAGLIVEGTFTSIPAVVSTFKWGWLPVGPLITQRFDAESRAGRLTTPVLVVHGDQDQLIPQALGRALYDRVKAPKRFVLVEGGTHYSTSRRGLAQYREAMRELFGWPA